MPFSFGVSAFGEAGEAEALQDMVAVLGAFEDHGAGVFLDGEAGLDGEKAASDDGGFGGVAEVAEGGEVGLVWG